MTLQATWFASAGLQMVMFPYLLVDRLGLEAELVGIAQATIMLPTFLLMLPGGALADRFDGRSILAIAYGLAAIPPIALALIVFEGWLSFPALLIFGASMGILGAFSTPARDSLLNRVVVASGGGMSLQRAVTLSTMIMFASQITGMILASQGDRIGASFILVVQGAVLLSSLWFVRQIQLPSRPKIDHGTGIIYQLAQMKEGLVEAFSHRQIMPVIVIAFCIGIFYIGAFNVILPIQIRDAHGGGAARFALMSISFFSGTIISSVALFRHGGIHHAGRAIVLAVSTGAMVLALLSFEVPYYALLGFVFFWGLGGGVVITISRAIVQELAPESHRGRLLAIFSMGFMGGAPLGSFGMGYLIEYLGPFHAARVPSVLMFIALLSLVAFTELWRVTFPRHGHSADTPSPD